MANLLNKILYVYDVERSIWFWYKHEQDLFYTCDQMSEEQIALPTFFYPKQPLWEYETFTTFHTHYWNFKILLNEV